MNINRLPEEDGWGNYWFGKPGCSTSPAIFPLLSDPKLKGNYFLQLGEQGCVFETGTGKFQAFPTAEKALRELQIRLKLRGIRPGKRGDEADE